MNEDEKNKDTFPKNDKETNLDTLISKVTSEKDKDRYANATESELLDIIKNQDGKITNLIKRAERAERLLEKANHYNEDLKVEIANLSSELHAYRLLKKHGKSVQIQVSEKDIIEATGEKPMPTWGTTAPEDGSLSSISESLKAVAEEVIQNQDLEENQNNFLEKSADASSEYVYDAQTGFYYHPASGYYWDPTSCLFYDYTSGTYYSYDEASGKYMVHSQVDVTDNNQCQMVWQSSPSGVDSLSSQFSVLSINTQRYQKNALEVAEQHPPCIRMIVLESDCLTLGSLVIITCAGGTIGREPDRDHVLELPDLNVSKIHARVEFDYNCSSYFVTDNGSQNGTLLNSQRLSESKTKSAAHHLSHGDVLEVGSSRLLLHIHSGHETCEDCEPGQVQAKLRALNPVKNDHVILSKDEKNRQRIKELKQIKKRYGLQNSYFENSGASISNSSDYCDKAFLRRKYIGSLPPEIRDVTREMPASTQRPIAASNKGHKLLSKMGWKEGQGLGKTSSGIATPVTVELRVNQSAGLGSSANHSLSLDNVHKAKKAQRWSAARQMYSKLEAQEREANRHLGLNTSQPETEHGIGSEKNQSDSHEVDGPSITSTVSSDCMDLDRIPSLSLNEFSHSKALTPVTSATPATASSKKYSSVPKISWVKGATQLQSETTKNCSDSQSHNTKIS